MAVTKRARHAATLVRNGYVMNECVARILAHFDRATPADIEAGASWYGEDASALISDLARVGNVSRECAAAVVAQLSPRTTWGRNVAAASAMLTAYGTGSAPETAAIAVGAMRANVSRAAVAIATYEVGGDPIDTVNGPKTNAFARNLTGDRDAVTVDVWAARIALNPNWRRGEEDPSELHLGRAGMYDALAECYRLAARARGVDATTMQATTWIVVRNGRSA